MPEIEKSDIRDHLLTTVPDGATQVEEEGGCVKAEKREYETERDVVESKLKEIFGDKLCPVEEAHEIISRFKDGSFAMSEMGMMLYTNGYNLRGRSTNYPNGMIYYDGENIFGVGYFAKEGERGGHLMIIAPKGREPIKAVEEFIAKSRETGICQSTVYVRHLNEKERDAFLKKTDMKTIENDPWHPEAMQEDEQYPNRVFDLDELMRIDDEGNVKIENLTGKEAKRYKGKNRKAFNRFNNFLQANDLRFVIEPYDYSKKQGEEAQGVAERYFEGRGERGGVVGSAPEDYFSLIKQKPHGENGKDYFSYLGYLLTSGGERLPIMFFAGEKLAKDKAAFYVALALRFPEYFKDKIAGIEGFTAISQYAWLRYFMELKGRGIKTIDAGGSETEKLDDQKRQLGGRPQKSYWVVKNS